MDGDSTDLTQTIQIQPSVASSVTSHCGAQAATDAAAKQKDTVCGRSDVETVDSPARLPIVPGVNISHRIGRGSCGSVYAARLVSNDRAVCVKILSASLADGPIDRRLRREAFITAMLSHRHIVRTVDFGEISRIPYLVTELVPGLSLDRLPPIGMAGICEIGRQVSSALAATHRAGVVHRDVKPANIVASLDGKGFPRAKLIDFGLARCPGDSDDEDGLIRPRQSLGSPPHVSPEQISGPVVVDGRADIYSLGSTLFEMLTGSPPFGSTVPETLTRKCHESAPPLRSLRQDVPPALERLVAAMLKRKRVDRPAEASAVAAELADLASSLR
ncbi:serine/threonine-protein kinase [Stratiformator vulcanicus]|uniref:serine/threonine-protein kinase n=1 Tax=Stratiformator vulcanicus TaxID=2527980 RepID=UPI002877DE2A|nr:serine/threonine-protein kinase [Stratiformator vulcanicus]